MNHDDTFKANHTPDNTPPRTEIEARIVAWVLGEASPFEVDELERLCAAQPELAVFKNRISAVHGLVATSAKPVDPTLRLSPDRRAKLLAILGSAPASEKVEGDLRAPSNPSEQSLAQPILKSVSEPGSRSDTQVSADSVQHASARQPSRKSNVVAFASAIGPWALPIAACFVLFLGLSAFVLPQLGIDGYVPFASKKPKRPDPSSTMLGAYTPAAPSEARVDNSVTFARADSQPIITGLASVGTGHLSGSAMPADDEPPAVQFSAQPSQSGNINLGASRNRFASNGVSVLGNISSASSSASERDVTFGGVDGELKFDTDAPRVRPAEKESAQKIAQHTAPASIFRTPSSYAYSDDSGKDLRVNRAVGAPADYFDAPASELTPPVAADPFAPPPTARSLDVASLELRARRAKQAGKNLADKDVAERGELAKLSAKARSQYLVGDSDGAQETFRQIETNDPANAEAKSFLTRIANEKAQIGELNRAKARAEKIEEVSNAWQRPEVYIKSLPSSDVIASGKWKPAILGKDREKDAFPSVTITAGTPQKFTTFELTDADKAEIVRRVRKMKAERTAGSSVVDKQIGDASVVYDHDIFEPLAPDGIFKRTKEYSAALAEVTAEIKAAEAKAAQAEAEAAEKVDARAIPPTATIDSKVLESFRAELVAKDEAMSTFSLHVSNASYRLAKDALAKGLLPNPDTIRPEEFYNAFDYGDPAPVAGEPVAARIEQSAHPFMQQRNLVRIAMRVPAVGRGASQPLRLTVMLDTSGSMEREDRSATVRAALASLTSLLGPNDRVTLIGFARTPRLIAENVAGDKAATLLDAAAKTPSEGGTNLEEALRLAETQALRQYTDGAQNRIVLLTDGATNLGDADPVSLATRIEKLRQRGVAFDACGIVAEGLNDNVLESLTRKGDGRYSIINSPEDADANFARQLAGAFRPAAKDVKVQVHFNPARVGRYRLIGFEQHRLKTEDFRNDAVDAAELASEEAATALYQVEVLPQGEGELGEVSVRFLDTNTNQRVERSWTIAYDAKPPAFAKASASIQLAGSAAFLAEKLRGGELSAQFRLEDFTPVVNGLATAYPNSAPVREFITTFQQARRATGD